MRPRLAECEPFFLATGHALRNRARPSSRRRFAPFIRFCGHVSPARYHTHNSHSASSVITDVFSRALVPDVLVDGGGKHEINGSKLILYA